MADESKQALGDGASFEELLGRLEQIVGELEDGPLGLAEALQRYEEGVRCLKQCYGTLEQAERRIEMVAGVDAQGEPVTETLADDTLSLEEKAAARSRRRSRTARSAAEGTADAAGASKDEDDSSSGRGTIDRGKSLF